MSRRVAWRARHIRIAAGFPAELLAASPTSRLPIWLAKGAWSASRPEALRQAPSASGLAAAVGLMSPLAGPLAAMPTATPTALVAAMLTAPPAAQPAAWHRIEYNTQ